MFCLKVIQNLIFYLSGPLWTVVDNKAMLVGVTQTVFYDCTPGINQIFARVTKGLQWILETSDAAKWQC